MRPNLISLSVWVPNPQGLTHADDCPMNEDGVECTCRLEARIAKTHGAGCSCLLCRPDPSEFDPGLSHVETALAAVDRITSLTNPGIELGRAISDLRIAIKRLPNGWEILRTYLIAKREEYHHHAKTTNPPGIYDAAESAINQVLNKVDEIERSHQRRPRRYRFTVEVEGNNPRMNLKDGQLTVENGKAVNLIGFAEPVFDKDTP